MALTTQEKYENLETAIEIAKIYAGGSPTATATPDDVIYHTYKTLNTIIEEIKAEDLEQNGQE
ncbi:hypothetical protein JCM14469_07840 [Desulfatiferula olefinivorans]